jgi:S1-C subfamily serine protease
MVNRRRNPLTRLSGRVQAEARPVSSRPPETALGDISSVELLDAYSRAVMTVVDAVGPAIVSISIGEGRPEAGFEPTGAGSGFVITPDGYIVTNSHVIAQAQGIGFAIPAGTAKSLVPQLLAKGRVERSYIGVIGFRRLLSRRLVRFHGLSKDYGVEVVSLEPGGPAQRAGVRTGDIIVSLNGREVTSPDDLFSFLSEWPVGRPLAITVLRWKSKLDIKVVTGAAAARD